MSPRPLSREELQDLGIPGAQIEKILVKRQERPVRRYKYIAFLTLEEAKKASQATKRDFVRATEYMPRRRHR